MLCRGSTKERATPVEVCNVYSAGSIRTGAVGERMQLPRRSIGTGLCLAQVFLLSGLAVGQSPQQASPAPSDPSAGATKTEGAGMSPAGDPGTQAARSSAGDGVPVKKYTVPAGTKVLLQLRSGINTKSARVGDGVYLASTFPVVVGNRVMIPAGVYVQGTVDRVARAGRIKGKAQLDMHFTSIIFPNGTVVEIPGMVNSLPGARKQQVKNDGEGTIEQDGDKGRNAAKTAEIAIPTGGTIGSIGGLASDHPLAGGLAGLGAGLATVGLVSLFTRGADVNIDAGTQVEMVFQRPLILEEDNLSDGTAHGSPNLVPSPDQPRPIEKPNRARVLCPAGGLGCQ